MGFAGAQRRLEKNLPTTLNAMEAPAANVEVLETQIARLRDRLKLAVIFGGQKSVPGAVINPSNNPRSWKSYEAVAQDIAAALKGVGFRHVELMPDDMMLGDRIRRTGTHLAWLNTGGVQGYNPACHAPAMLEMFGIPYVGHDPLVATILDNKHTFKRELIGANIPTAPFMTWHLARGPFLPKVNSRFARIFEDYRGPFVVKPISGRASLHVHVADSANELPDAVDEVFSATENHVLIEAFLPGRELCVAVGGVVTAHRGRLAQRSVPFVFSELERNFEAGERIFASMDLRPIDASRFRPLDAVADARLLSELRVLARDVYFEFHLGSLIRLDVRADAAGRLMVLEANLKPDLKRPSAAATSLVCAGLGEHGMNYDDLILSLLADRLNMLFSHRRSSVRHLIELLD
jgi:D-alanine-D-alanine ligase